jgi:SOS-response transcriptional repressor LexA/DNA-binding transcriptional regulator YiaG
MVTLEPGLAISQIWYAGVQWGHIDGLRNAGGKERISIPMRKKPSKVAADAKPEWADTISTLRKREGMSQTAFGQRLHSSAMAVSRWERGAQEPPSHSYIELGNLAGDPACWYFWGRAGLRSEDLMRVLPELRNRLSRADMPKFQVVRAGSAGKVSAKQLQLVAIPLLKVVAASHGDKGDNAPILQDAPVESMIAAPKEWCPHPASTSCVRVHGDSMSPLIDDGYILAVDSSQSDRSKLDGKIVIAWHKDVGLTVSRLRRYDHTEVLHPENASYKSVTLDNRNKWKIVGKVLWWIGRAP